MILFTLAACVPPLAATPHTPPTVASCAACHPRVVREWRTSRHAAAATNANIRASLRHTTFAGWCLDCHAPLASRGRAEEGVTCVSCHPHHTRSPHPAPDPSLQRAERCGTCHEFALPKHHPMHTDELVQATVSEWRTSKAARAGVGCVDCHMGTGGHRFLGAHDPETARRALSVSATWSDPVAEVSLAATNVGHRVPTGDPARRLRVLACADPKCEHVTAARTLARVYTPGRWSLERDDTVPVDGQVVVRLDAPGATWWRVDLHYAEAILEPELTPDEVRLTLAEGPLIPVRPAP